MSGATASPLTVKDERDFLARELLTAADPLLATLNRRFSGEMHAKLGRKHAEGSRGWSIVDDSDWTVDVIKKRLLDHVEEGDPVDVANFALFWWYLETVVGQEPEARDD